MYFSTVFVYLVIIIMSAINGDEFIVKYTKWLNKKERLKILAKELPNARVYNMDEVSDFDTILLNGSKCFNQFHVSSKIDQVVTNKILRFTKPATRRQSSVHKSIDVAKLLNTNRIWSLGYTGKNVKVAVVDTGLSTKQKFVKNLEYQINFTNETDFNDNNGHGTFITSIIGSSNPQLLGLAPDVDLYILRTFDRNLKSFTSWFLRAFNFILLNKIHVVNLSLGSIDFTDTVFVNKIQELVANNIVIVSAAGNNGPIFGTINNPADQIEVIGVGTLGSLSSRGMTTWELPEGIGRLKPDIVTFGDNIWGIGLKNKRTVLSGSSVASAVITGAVALLLSYKFRPWNVGFVKQALMSTADRYKYPLDEFHQGFGQLNLIEAFQWFRFKSFQISLSPSSINFLDCPYQWVNCVQPMYYTAMPYMFNITVINSIRKKSKITAIVWEPYEEFFGANLNVSCDYGHFLWLWHGYLSVFLTVNKDWQGIIEGRLRIVIDNDYAVTLPIKVKVIETPPRSKRLLWDQYHNLQYPKHCIISDDLENLDKQPVDWTGDHLYTNFRQLYNHLRSHSYYVEVLTQRYNCFNATNYGALIIMDPEETFTVEEVIKLQNDVNDRNISLIIIADWYNDNLLKKFDVFVKKKFFNCKNALMAGANLNSLNYLLKNWSISLSNDVFSGNFSIGNHPIRYQSGTSINMFPGGSTDGILYATELNRISLNKVERVPILGLFRNGNRGKIAIFGDSNCLDEIFNENFNCYWLMDVILQFALNGHVSGILQHSHFAFDKLNVDVYKTFFASSNEESCKTLKWLSPNLIKTRRYGIFTDQSEDSLLKSFASQRNQSSPWIFLVLIISLSFFILFMLKYFLKVKFLK